MERINITYGIDKNGYKTDKKVTFSDSEISHYFGDTENTQIINYKGKKIGLLYELQPYSIFEPLRHSFILYINSHKRIDSEHFIFDDFPTMQFSNIDECLNWYEANKDIVHTY